MLAALRDQIATIVVPPPAVLDVVAIGIPALDAVLPGGGVPCGRLTEVAGRSGSGATSLVRTLVASALHDKRWVAYIDAARTLAPADWAPLATSGRLWVVRPPTDDHGAWCADLLLRSNAFGLVVLDDSSPMSRRTAVRLTRLAQECNAAFVVVHHHDAGQQLVGSALRLHVQRRTSAVRPVASASSWRHIGTRLAHAADGRETHRADAGDLVTQTRRTFSCTVAKGGKSGPQTVEVQCVFDLARRLRSDPPVPDRRGVAARNRLGERADPNAPGTRRTTGDGRRETGNKRRETGDRRRESHSTRQRPRKQQPA